MRPLARAGSAAEKDDFLGESQVLAAILRLQMAPHIVKDDLRVLDFEILMRAAARRFGVFGFRSRVVHG